MPSLLPKGSSSLNPITEDDDVAFKSPKKPTPPGEWSVPKHWNVASKSTSSWTSSRRRLAAVSPIRQPASQGADDLMASTVLKDIANAPQPKEKEKCPECGKSLTPKYMYNHLDRKHNWSNEKILNLKQQKAMFIREHGPKRVKRTHRATSAAGGQEEMAFSIDDFQRVCEEQTILDAAKRATIPSPHSAAEDGEGIGVYFLLNQPSETVLALELGPCSEREEEDFSGPVLQSEGLEEEETDDFLTPVLQYQVPEANDTEAVLSSSTFAELFGDTEALDDDE